MPEEGLTPHPGLGDLTELDAWRPRSLSRLSVYPTMGILPFVVRAPPAPREFLMQSCGTEEHSPREHTGGGRSAYPYLGS